MQSDCVFDTKCLTHKECTITSFTSTSMSKAMFNTFSILCSNCWANIFH